ncbi:ABC transporter permease subunit [Roseomonas xinghualingensis]|uniref:ABC transporter permease subunit n=1 Tax=Roseomonas xinghualingensis TaxID=2986475 RepID=UPI0021F133E0|nr:ABC transporter permease subunit [Roseomonas sp. SXEYE001]MCV4208295.1 ABC transporter permease subunit [Roseomonas sp. SXEYE001]
MIRLAALLVLLALLAPLPTLLLAGGAADAGEALRNSLLTALPAALASTLLGTAAGIGLQARFLGRGLALALIGLPLLLPPAIPAAALMLAAEHSGHGAGLPGAVLWHMLLGAPLVTAIIWAALRRIDPALFRVAAACGVSPGLAVRRIVWPRLLPAMLLGAGLSFGLSMGESTLAVMSGTGTLPVAVLSGAGSVAAVIWPLLAAVGALVLVLAAGQPRGEAPPPA